MNEKLLRANHRNVRLQGTVYRILSVKLGTRVYAQAEPINVQAPLVNLITGRSPLVKNIRNLVDLNLFV